MLSRSFAAFGGIQEFIVNTGQHYADDMSSVFFQQLHVPRPYADLGVGSGRHGAQTGRMLEGIERVLLDLSPDWVMVMGDTNSTLAGAVAAAKLHIPIAHLEAGVRSFDHRMPEEINRIVADRVSTLLLAPSDVAVGNLRREGVNAEAVVNVGDIMLDVFQAHSSEAARIRPNVLDRCGVRSKEYILATIHRAENTDEPDRLRRIMCALAQLGRDLPIVFPVHPRTRAAFESLNVAVGPDEGLRTTAPLGYLEMQALEMESKLIVTDSGGVQKEAFYAGVPCVVLRAETEWPELIDMGWTRLAVPDSVASILNACREWLTGRERASGSPYGDGSAGRRTVQALMAAAENQCWNGLWKKG